MWHRRAGKDVTALNWTVRSAFQRRGLYWHILPTYEQGRKIVWNGMGSDGRRFLDYWPEQTIVRRREDLMLLELASGSIWQVVGTDDPDRLVGANPVGCVFSEYSIQNPRAWDLIRPILNENGGWALFIYTARGRNHGYDMLQDGLENEEWFAELLTVDDTKKPLVDPMTQEPILGPDGKQLWGPVVTKKLIDDDRRMGMAEEVILQEYWNSFDAPLTGSYYGTQMTQALDDGRITNIPWDSHRRVETWWDIGIGKRDANAIWFVQEDDDGYLNCIDYEERATVPFSEWVKILEAKPYVYGQHIAPHDFNHKEYMGGHKRVDQARREYNMTFLIAPKMAVSGVDPEGINAVRGELPRCRFDKTRCKQGIEALRQYRKEQDEKHQYGSQPFFKDKPLHDWASHGADAFRTGITGRRDTRKWKAPTQVLAEGDYDILTGVEPGQMLSVNGQVLQAYADDDMNF